ncbi:transposase [Streptomyces dysideae]|uniref:Transposase n=1 Tax=Streptomyces dysideae TaxID=909626 RepID=A0A101UX43_9ACTN|nr:transposase [Streptomyces dysideae]KUO18433.1 transposase [Streptomyces dysideae]
MSVIRLPLVVGDADVRRRVEQLFSAMWTVKRALQRDARDVVDAYWAGDVRRERDVKAWRAELGLSRTGLEHRAYRHLERSGWLSDHVSKALVMHQADEVWAGVARHLHPDTSGRRAGRPKTGTWWEYTRIPGRARSHTTDRKWETFRLHGTLAGHLEAFRHPALAPSVTNPAQAAGLSPGMRVLAQPRRLPAPARPTGSVPTGLTDTRGRPRSRAATWFEHTGPLAVVFAGGPTGRGEMVLPVRLPQGVGRWPYLLHYLNDPSRWHKIDLVRRRDPAAPGGWAYEAHLMVLAPGHASTATRTRRRQAAALQRVGGVDGNVSNLAVVSLPTTGEPDDGPVRSSRITLTEQEQDALATARKKARGRQRALDRSRRATNPQQYQHSRRQKARDERRQAQGLPPKAHTAPAGPRHTTATGEPQQAYHRDTVSTGYRNLRARHSAAAVSAAEASHHRAKKTAAALVAAHGPNLTVEDCDIRTWFRLWGRACSATTPGRLITALAAECTAAGGRLLRASTFTTALSQHCLCGRRVTKSLRRRAHHCDPADGGCGLKGDRDLVSAALAAFTTLTDPDDPATARLDHARARAAQILFAQGLQEALTESTAPKSAPSGRTRAAADPRGNTLPRQRTASARRNAGPCTVATPDETRPAPQRPKAHAGTTRPHTGRPRTHIRDKS